MESPQFLFIAIREKLKNIGDNPYIKIDHKKGYIEFKILKPIINTDLEKDLKRIRDIEKIVLVNS